jgi:uncharacterized hydrophobic protein (TIGR00271 family)
MMKDSNQRENVKMDVSKDAKPAAFEHENRRMAGDKHGLGRRRISAEQRQEILNELFFEEEERMPYVKHFYSLLTVSTLIACLGLVRNSPSVVIGAMLLSPLMTPILAFAAGLVMGWPVRSGRLAIRLFLATLFVFGLAYLLPFVMGVPKNVLIPTELLARTNPKMAELLIALSAGIAAALMLLRRETLAILPGVAISVALGAFNVFQRLRPGLECLRTLCHEPSGNHPHGRHRAAAHRL